MSEPHDEQSQEALTRDPADVGARPASGGAAPRARWRTPELEELRMSMEVTMYRSAPIDDDV